MENSVIKIALKAGSVLTIHAAIAGDTLHEIDAVVAAEHGEARIQLKEGCAYEYVFEDENLDFRETAGIVNRSKLPTPSGRLTPNIFVGTLALDVINTGDGQKVESVDFEVQSVKSDYRTDYRFMLDSIAGKCTDLLMQTSSPISQIVTPDFGKDYQTDYQRFSFVYSMIDSEPFKEAIGRILTAPVTNWKRESEEVDIRKVRRFTKSIIRQIGSRNPRMNIPESHPIRDLGVHSFPTKVTNQKHIDTVDTAENRFIKHVLETFLDFCTKFDAAVKDESRGKREARAAIEKLEGWLSHSLFSEVSRPTMLRFDSPVLQKKAGYREVLKAWLVFDLAAKLIWKGGEDVYHAGKRDVATLYEYWLFFTLLDLVCDLFHIEKTSIDGLISKTDNGLGLCLKQGEHTAVKGVFNSGTRKLEVRLHYNRTFSRNRKYRKSGSWSTSMRPDYTISFWPFGMTEKNAEKQALITHVHFDAKYKIENFVGLLQKSDVDQEISELNREKVEQNEGKYKKVDILKMHSYRDAIRRTGGAYVLYPGDKQERLRGFNEILPGLGAFPVKPSQTHSGIAELKQFLEELVRHFLNRASQRERMSHRTWSVYREKPNYIDELMPEPRDSFRDMIPDDTYVMIGICKDEFHRNWINTGNQYNVRVGDRSGAISITGKEVDAKYLLLYEADQPRSGVLKRVFGKGPRFYDSRSMKSRGYDSENNYLLFSVTDDIPEEFKNVAWDLNNLPQWVNNDPEGAPFVITLTDLMKLKIDDRRR